MGIYRLLTVHTVSVVSGITLSALWTRLGARKPAFPLVLDDDIKSFLWSTVIVSHPEIDFYVLPEPRPPLVLYNRFDVVDPETQIVLDQVCDKSPMFMNVWVQYFSHEVKV